jgi:BirA family biotin operon repressor/biotin-[acetyl-CoA-carboxylase] ligase
MDVGYWLWERGMIEAGGAVLAVSQWAGRGQKRRVWDSPPGNLHATWLWPRSPACPTGIVPLVVCLEIIRVLESFNLQPRIKWPNDILLDGFKIGGILTEERGEILLIGIGLNLAWAPVPQVLRLEGSLPSAALSDYISFSGPLEIWSALASGYSNMIKGLTLPENRERIVRQAENRLAWLGETVLIQPSGSSDASFKAILVGLTSDGGLKVEKKGRLTMVYSSERVVPVSFF